MDLDFVSSTWESRLKLYKGVLCLAYQSLGVVYGDLSTSPIYVYKSTFSKGSPLHGNDDYEILGILSLVIWTLTIIPLCKYILFVLWADDNGEGGTFALYSLLCRCSKMGLLNNFCAAHGRISSCKSRSSTMETRTSLIIKDFFERHRSSRIILLLVVLLGTSMVIGDGILTPTMSVLSAVHGIKIKHKELHENYTLLIAGMILVGLFALQHHGTCRVGFLFAPILMVWLLCIGGTGIYNIIHWNPCVVCALSPYYIYNFFKKTGRDRWSSLGGVVPCVTGAEAMFADLGHFSKLSVRIAFTVLVYPCLILAYMGEAAYLSNNSMDLHSFYESIPEHIFWPVFIIATLATVVASQAIISATFSIISQCRALSCFPRVKIMHTSSQIHGQIYIPEVNWILMILCLAVVIVFRDTEMIGNAYGLAVIMVMFVTTCLMFLIISTVWNQSIMVAILFVVIFGSVELVYISACLAKIHKGGWLPLLFSLVILSLMSIWHYGTSEKLAFELNNKISLESLLSLGPSLGMIRVPGIGLVYSKLVSGVPPMFVHFVTNFPAFHRILVFVTIQPLTSPEVPDSERFLVSRIGYPEFCLFRCIVRYGYKDVRDSDDFESQLIEKVREFLQGECHAEELEVNGQSPVPQMEARKSEAAGTDATRRRGVGFQSCELSEEVIKLMEEKEAGVTYMIGNACVVADEASSLVKKFAINTIYGFIRRNCRRPAMALGLPHESLIEVGMVYYV